MLSLPERPSLEFLRKLAKARKRERSIGLSRAQHEIAREYGFDSWPKLVRHVKVTGLSGIERALVLADPVGLARYLPGGDDSLLVLLRRSIGSRVDVQECARILLAAGADPNSHTVHDGQWQQSALFDAVEREDSGLVQLLISHGAVPDEDAFYHACEQSDTSILDALYQPGFERLVNHKLDFEDVHGLQWFLDRGVDVDSCYGLHHAISRGRSLKIIEMLIDAGADVNKPWDRWDVGRRPLALAARCGHLAAYEFLLSRGAEAALDPVDSAVLAVARGESVVLPKAVPPALGNPCGDDYSWILGQFALLGRTDVVRSLLDTGMAVDTRGWSNFTPLDQAAMHGRTDTVRLLLERGADLHDCAFDDDGPTPLDCAIWGMQNNRAEDGDYRATIEILVEAGGSTQHTQPTGDAAVDRMLGP